MVRRRRPASLLADAPSLILSQAGAARRAAAARLLAPTWPSDRRSGWWLRDLSLFAPAAAFDAPQQVQATPLVCKLLKLLFTGYILHEGGSGATAGFAEPFQPRPALPGPGSRAWALGFAVLRVERRLFGGFVVRPVLSVVEN